MAEIVPHDTEYIRNCYSDEILAEMEKKQMTEAVSVSHKKAQKRTGRASTFRFSFTLYIRF